MANRKKSKKIKKPLFFIKSGLYVLLLFMLVNGVVFYTVNFFVRGETTCMTQTQIAADNRCLYILNGKIFSQGTRSAPHKGHPCGTDVSSIIPAFHTATPAIYLNPNYVADVCAAGISPAISLTPTPTIALPTLTPPVSPSPSDITPTGDTIMNISLFFHGIGKAGDAVNPLTQGAPPVDAQRYVTLMFLNDLGVQLVGANGTVHYDPQRGSFTGKIILPSTIPAGAYGLQIKVKHYVKKQLTSKVQIIKGTVIPLPDLYLFAGDADDDDKLTILDYNFIRDCYSDTLPSIACDAAKKSQADINNDGAVNQIDYNLFLREFVKIAYN